MGTLQFNLDEVLEMAEQIERNGARFYRFAGEVVQDDRLCRLLLDLAVMEDEHERVFHQLRQTMVRPEWQAERASEDEQTVLYLRAMADTSIFDVRVDPLVRLGNLTSIEEVLSTAVTLEKESIAFYVGLQKLTQPNHGQEQIDEIIREEIKHVVTLNQVRHMLQENKG